MSVNPQLPDSTTTYSRHVVGVIKSPLGFFALALLIVEGLLMGAGIFFDLPLVWKLIALGTGVGLFLAVFIVVVWLVVKHPRNLVFTEHAHIVLAKLSHGDSTRTIDVVQVRDAIPNPQAPGFPPSQILEISPPQSNTQGGG